MMSAALLSGQIVLSGRQLFESVDSFAPRRTVAARPKPIARRPAAKPRSRQYRELSESEVRRSFAALRGEAPSRQLTESEVANDMATLRDDGRTFRRFREVTESQAAADMNALRGY